MTPYEVHYGFAAARVEQRSKVLLAAYQAHPERFPRGLPKPPEAPTEVWINKPVRAQEVA